MFVGGPAWVVFSVMLVGGLYVEYHIRCAKTSTRLWPESRFGEEDVILATTEEYSIGLYGVKEIGNSRLAIRGYIFPGATGGGEFFLYALNQGEGWSSSASTTWLSSSERGIPGGAHCTFGPVSYDIIFGQLHIDGKAFDLLSSSQSIIVNRVGKVLSVHKLPENSPAIPPPQKSSASLAKN